MFEGKFGINFYRIITEKLELKVQRQEENSNIEGAESVMKAITFAECQCSI